MLLRVLGSNSRGNCYLLQNEKETLIIECGISFKEIKIALDFNLRNVVGCLVTHCHGDHSKAVKDVMKSGIRVYTGKGTIEALELKNRLDKPIKAFEQVKIGEFTILPFDVHHDVEEPLGFIVSHKEIGNLLFATDTSYIEYKFNNLSHILIECNYSTEILLRNMDTDSIDSSTGLRIASTHMSLDNCREFIKANKYQILISN